MDSLLTIAINSLNVGFAYCVTDKQKLITRVCLAGQSSPQHMT